MVDRRSSLVRHARAAQVTSKRKTRPIPSRSTAAVAHARVLAHRLRAGDKEPLVTPEAAAAYPYRDAERVTIEKLRRKAFVGTADAVRSRLTELADRFTLEELAIVTWTHDPPLRHRSYELLPETFRSDADLAVRT